MADPRSTSSAAAAVANSGLENPEGQDCWANAVLQLIHIVPELRDEIVHEGGDPQGEESRPDCR